MHREIVTQNDEWFSRDVWCSNFFFLQELSLHLLMLFRHENTTTKEHSTYNLINHVDDGIFHLILLQVLSHEIYYIGHKYVLRVILQKGRKSFLNDFTTTTVTTKKCKNLWCFPRHKLYGFHSDWCRLQLMRKCEIIA